jgi:uncharacterized delta-60 repeat protein
MRSIVRLYCPIVATLILTICATSDNRTLAQINNGLDPTFGVGGTVTTGLTGIASAVIVQPDGKILSIGSTVAAGVYSYAVIRHNNDGSLDTGFGVFGRVIVNYSTGYAYGRAIALQSDGKIILAGEAQPLIGGGGNIGLMRLNSDGSLDSTFGNNGKVLTTALGSQSRTAGVVILPDSKILVAGTAISGTTGNDFALVRFNSNGTLDSSFGNNGAITTHLIGPNDVASGVALQTDGRIVVAGSIVVPGEGDLALVRYTPDGDLDLSFGVGGKVIISNVPASGVNLQVDGKIVVAGTTRTATINDFAVARFMSDGNLDTSFGGDGIVNTDFYGQGDYANAVSIQNDGKIVAAGVSYNGTIFVMAVARYNSDGNLDLTFNGDGRLTIDFLGRGSRGTGTAIQPDGKIVVGGNANVPGSSDGAFALARLLATQEPIQVMLSRDGSNNLRATITITNPLPDPVPGVTVTLVRASTLDGSQFVDGVPVPQSLGTVNPGQSVTATVTFPGTSGVPAGFAGLVRVNLSYTGGTYTETKNVTTP